MPFSAKKMRTRRGLGANRVSRIFIVGILQLGAAAPQVFVFERRARRNRRPGKFPTRSAPDGHAPGS
jgi:hypothetical protein